MDPSVKKTASSIKLKTFDSMSFLIKSTECLSLQLLIGEEELLLAETFSEFTRDEWVQLWFLLSLLLKYSFLSFDGMS